MIKSIKAIMRQDREPYRVPRRVQDVIPIQCVWPKTVSSSSKYLLSGF